MNPFLLQSWGNKVQFLENDWNPADGDTHWEALGVIVVDPYLLDFIGPNVTESFVGRGRSVGSRLDKKLGWGTN